MSEEKRPNPGSPEAGCRCPVLDNGHGRGSGYKDKDGTPQFYISSDCPMHGLKLKEELYKKLRGESDEQHP